MKMTRNSWILLLPLLVLSSCARMYIESGKEAVNDFHYNEGIKDLERGLSKKVDPEANLALARAYFETNQFSPAADNYKIASTSTSATDLDRMHYAMSLMAVKKYSEAEVVLDDILTRDADNKWVQQLKTNANQAPALSRGMGLLLVRPVNIPELDRANSPVRMGDSFIVSGQTSTTGPKDPYNNLKFYDLYLLNDSMGSPQLLKGANTPYHDASPSISNDLTTMFITRSNEKDSKKIAGNTKETSLPQIYELSEDKNGSWSEAKITSFSEPEHSYAHPAISSDGKTLYFSSDRQGGYGGMDLWKVNKNGNNWGEPQNLGSVINTPGNEVFPTLGKDDTFYYSSDGLLSLGGLDIMKTNYDGFDWTVPEHMGYPINSSTDDFGLLMNDDGESGYFSSDRKAIDKIYTFRILSPELKISGDIVDEETGEPVEGIEVIVKNLTDGTEETVITDENGKFTTDVESGKEYEVVTEQDKYLSSVKEVSTIGKIEDEEISITYELDPLTVGTPDIYESGRDIPEIYWDYDRANIRSDAKPYLDAVVKVLKDNNNVQVEISSHCDTRGTSEYNQFLSEKRAKAVTNYLIQKGINSSRLMSKGYGKSQLINKCSGNNPCTAAQHAENRRTEFRVIGLESPLNLD